MVEQQIMVVDVQLHNDTSACLGQNLEFPFILTVLLLLLVAVDVTFRVYALLF